MTTDYWNMKLQGCWVRCHHGIVQVMEACRYNEDDEDDEDNEEIFLRVKGLDGYEYEIALSDWSPFFLAEGFYALPNGAVFLTRSTRRGWKLSTHQDWYRDIADLREVLRYLESQPEMYKDFEEAFVFDHKHKAYSRYLGSRQMEYNSVSVYYMDSQVGHICNEDNVSQLYLRHPIASRLPQEIQNLLNKYLDPIPYHLCSSESQETSPTEYSLNTRRDSETDLSSLSSLLGSQPAAQPAAPPPAPTAPIFRPVLVSQGTNVRARWFSRLRTRDCTPYIQGIAAHVPLELVPSMVSINPNAASSPVLIDRNRTLCLAGVSVSVDSEEGVSPRVPIILGISSTSESFAYISDSFDRFRRNNLETGLNYIQIYDDSTDLMEFKYAKSYFESWDYTADRGLLSRDHIRRRARHGNPQSTLVENILSGLHINSYRL